jgi:pimeloyl-ACP methyl ester carboxylesterase
MQETFEQETYEPEPWAPPEIEPEHREFKTDDGLTLRYLDWPADAGAPILMMIHGRRAHARWFDPVVRDLSPRYRCVSLDLRGHGESEADGEPASLHRYSADVAQFMKLFSGQKLILMLHSMSGRFGIFAHQHHGAKPDLLVMADTPIYRRPHHQHPEPEFKPKRYPTKESALQRFRLMPMGTTAHPDLLRYVAEHALRENEDGTWGWKFDERTSTRPFGSDFPDAMELDLESLDVPTLVIYGEHSGLITPIEAQMMAGRMPTAKLVELPGTYHHIMLDRPSAFNRELLEFFGEHGF